jgi:hypothetical protein
MPVQHVWQAAMFSYSCFFFFVQTLANLPTVLVSMLCHTCDKCRRTINAEPRRQSYRKYETHGRRSKGQEDGARGADYRG